MGESSAWQDCRGCIYSRRCPSIPIGPGRGCCILTDSAWKGPWFRGPFARGFQRYAIGGIECMIDRVEYAGGMVVTKQGVRCLSTRARYES